MRLIVNVACMGDVNHAYKLLFRKPEQKRELRGQEEVEG
jgi:hypothetical protein